MIRSLAVLALTLPACDSGGFTGSPTDYECRSGATLTATTGKAGYAAQCVESNVSSSGGLTVRS